MSIRVRCPNSGCGQPYQVPEEQLGHKAVCKKCGQSFTLSLPQRETLVSGAQSKTSSTPRPLVMAEVPSKLGRFEVRNRLGAGAFGAVYRASDPVLGREVALKVPHASTLQSEKQRARVVTEAKAAAQLRHPNIVPVYEAGHDGNTYYIASAFIEGQTLEDAIQQRTSEEKTFDFSQSAKLVMDLCGALHYAHQRGIVHRDIKPANIMLDTAGDPLVMDFGLARLEGDESRMTMDGTVLGTPAYMPPEQAGGQTEQIGPASDQYSLGAVLYELLCGQTPFSGPPQLVISLVLNQEPDPPRKTNPAIPKDLETICQKAMSKRRGHRYASCQAMAEDLRRWLSGEPITARRVSLAERFTRWCRRNPLVAGLSATAAALLLAVALVSLFAYAKTSRALATAETERQRAEDQRQRAERSLEREGEERKRAEDALGSANAERQRAEKSVQIAEEKSREAEAEKARAQQQVLLTLKASYVAQIGVAQRDILEGEYAHAERMLLLTAEDLRGWEYHHLSSMLKRRKTLEVSEAGHVTDVAFSPDGKRIVSAGGREVIVWDAVTGEKLLSLPAPSGKVERVTFSPDGKEIAMINWEHVAQVWDAASARNTLSRSQCSCLAFSPDGMRIVWGMQDGSLSIWDTRTGQETRSIRDDRTKEDRDKRKEGRVHRVMFLDDGKRICAIGLNTAKVLDATSYQEIVEFTTSNFHPMKTEPNRDGSRFVSETYGDVIFYDAAAKKEIVRLPRQSSSVAAIALSPNEMWIATAHDDGTVRIWDARTGSEVEKLVGHRVSIGMGPVTFSPDGRRLISSDHRGKIIVWNVAAGRDLQSPESLADHELKTSMVFTRDGSRTCAAGDGGIVKDIAFSPDGKSLVVCNLQGVSVWNAATGQMTQSIRTREFLPARVAFSPDAKQIVCGGQYPAETAPAKKGKHDSVTSLGGMVKLLDAVSGQEIRTLKGHASLLNCIALSPDGKRIASCGQAGIVNVWDAISGEEVLTINADTRPVRCIAFSRDGQQIISGHLSGTVGVWAANNGHQIVSCKAKREITDIAVSPDGRRIATSLFGGGVIVWDASTLGEVLTLEGNAGWTDGVAFSPDGRRIVSCGIDKTVRVWDASNAQELLVLKGHTTAVKRIAFSPDGLQLASCTDGVVKIWDGSPAPVLGHPAQAGPEKPAAVQSQRSASTGTVVTKPPASSVSPHTPSTRSKASSRVSGRN